jgi:hypothetical protein
MFALLSAKMIQTAYGRTRSLLNGAACLGSISKRFMKNGPLSAGAGNPQPGFTDICGASLVLVDLKRQTIAAITLSNRG